MALYQDIMKVPGLSGTWQQRNAQLYKLLGSPLGTYTGNYDQNVYLLNQITKNNYYKSGLPGSNQSSSSTSSASSASQAGKAAGESQAKDFSAILPYAQYFDPNLAQSAIAQRTARYYDPLVQQSISDLLTNYGGRNLTRSGAYNTDLGNTYSDYADQEAQMRENLYNTQSGEAQNSYSAMRALYENNPTGYKPTETKYTPYEVQLPESSAYKYGQDYRTWLKSKYNL